MKRVLTGIQASGDFHIGNYFGAVKPMLEFQADESVDLFPFVADLHAFTSHPEPDTFRQNLHNAVVDWLALGIDSEKSTFYRQSDVRAHTELFWLLLSHTSLGMLERAHSYKDKVAKGLEANAGLFTYPVLMACDILLYDADIVPVGKDQKQHVEMARDIAQRFNHLFGETFVLPEPQINENVQTIPGLDGAKMSKSYGNTIEIFADEKTIKKKIMSIKTDSVEMGTPIDPDTCTVFRFHELFGNPRLETLRNEYKAGKTGYGDSKKELFELMWDYFADARARKVELLANPDQIKQALLTGAQKANAIAEAKLSLVREKLGLPKQHIA